MTSIKAFRLILASATMLAGGTVALTPVGAQTTTASIRGQITDPSGAPAGSARVVAVNTATNQTQTVTADTTGNFSLNGLRPSEYRITATAADGTTLEQLVTVAIGQAATLDFALGAAGEPADTPVAGSGASDIIVNGSRLVETKTSEIATNVSQAQIRALPQTDRNFLSFAALAPGVRYNDSETDKSFTSGASTASQVNVFIDGVSLKNKLREGGVAGQQNSRGNPFGQLAVQEFRVLTQNTRRNMNRRAPQSSLRSRNRAPISSTAKRSVSIPTRG